MDVITCRKVPKHKLFWHKSCLLCVYLPMDIMYSLAILYAVCFHVYMHGLFTGKLVKSVNYDYTEYIHWYNFCVYFLLDEVRVT